MMKKKEEVPDAQQKEEAVSQGAAPPAAQDETVIQIPKAEHEKLLNQLKELVSLQDKMLRSAADFENAKKRLLKEKEEFSRFVLENLLYQLLPVLDNFERALSHKAELATPQEKSVWDGVELIYKQFDSVLKAQGLVRIEALKKPFDPNVHEAIARVEAEDGEGLVAEEIVTGYLLHGKVLRPAKVKVFMKPHAPGGEEIEEIT